MRCLPFAAFAFLFFTACPAETSFGSGEGAFEVENRCLARHQCGEAFDRCIESGKRTCDACIATGGFSCQQYCRYDFDCSDRHCQADDPCRISAWVAERGEVDPGIRAACEASAAQKAACGAPSWPEGSCEVFAATERPEAERVYRCTSRAACGEEAECGDLAPDAATARLFCTAVAECGGDCGADESDFAVWFGWLRADAKEALLQCLAIGDCANRNGCIGAWDDAFDID